MIASRGSTSLDAHSFDETSIDERTEHPTVERAKALLVTLMDRIDPKSDPDWFVDTAIRGLMDVVGGLAQATHSDHHDPIDRAHAIRPAQASVERACVLSRSHLWAAWNASLRPGHE